MNNDTLTKEARRLLRLADTLEDALTAFRRDLHQALEDLADLADGEASWQRIGRVTNVFAEEPHADNA